MYELSHQEVISSLWQGQTEALFDAFLSKLFIWIHATQMLSLRLDVVLKKCDEDKGEICSLSRQSSTGFHVSAWEVRKCHWRRLGYHNFKLVAILYILNPFLIVRWQGKVVTPCVYDHCTMIILLLFWMRKKIPSPFLVIKMQTHIFQCFESENIIKYFITFLMCFVQDIF